MQIKLVLIKHYSDKQRSATHISEQPELENLQNENAITSDMVRTEVGSQSLNIFELDIEQPVFRQ